MVHICEDYLKPCAEDDSSLVCQVPGGLGTSQMVAGVPDCCYYEHHLGGPCLDAVPESHQVAHFDADDGVLNLH